METLVAGVVAALVTLFDLDRNFYSPSNLKSRGRMYGWGTTWIVANGVAAGLVFVAIRDWAAFEDWPRLLTAVVAGVAFLTIIRTKVATLSINEKEVPIGIETLFDSARAFVFRRVKTISEQALYDDARASVESLQTLAERALLKIMGEEDPEVSRASKQWLLDLMEWEGDIDTKRLFVTCYLLSGKRVDAEPFLTSM